MAEPEPKTTRRHATGIWPLVHAERAALAADLADLTGEQWATPSLCTGLTVREVLAHLTAGASLTPVRWLAGVIRCRFDFDKQVAMRLAEQLGATPAETIARFRSVLTSTNKPPLPTLAMLGETIVHAAGHPAAAVHPPRLSDRDPHAGGRVLSGLRPPRPHQRTGQGPTPRRDRRTLQHRLRAARVRHHPGADHGNDRAQSILRRTPRRRCRHPAGAQRDPVTRPPEPFMDPGLSSCPASPEPGSSGTGFAVLH